MSKSHAIINVSTDAFLDWITKTNNIITFVNTEAVSANSSGAVTNGIGFVNGTFGANALVATTITGGNSSALGTLAIEANSIEAFEYVIVGANVSVNTSAMMIGNAVANVIITSSAIIGGPNAALNVVNVVTVNSSTIIGVGANVSVNTSAMMIGNSVSNVVITSSAIAGGPNAALNVVTTSSLNTASLGVGANIQLNSTALSVGNSSVFTNITSSAITGFSNAQLNVINTTTVNATTLVCVGANVRMNTTSLFVGNSVANVVANSTGITGNNIVFKTGTIVDSLTIGDSSVNTFINSSAINVTTAYFQTAVIESIELTDGFAVGVGTFSERMNVGSNVWINTSTFFIGNSSVNMSINSTGITGSFTLGGDILSANIVNATSLMLVGTNVPANATSFKVGNSVSNVVITSSAIAGGANATLNVVTTSSLNTTSLGVANVKSNTTAWFVGNSVSNVVITSSAIAGGANAALNIVTTSSLNTTSLGVGANVSVNTSAMMIGNSVSNVVITSNAIAVGANVKSNTTAWFVGNSVSNVVITSSAIAGGPNAALNVVSIESLSITTLTIPEIAIGANVSINSSVILVGNSIVNVSINSSSITGAPTINANTVSATTLVGVGANIHMNTSAFKVGNATVNTIITSSAITGRPNATLNVVSTLILNTTSFAVGANVKANVTAISIGNSSVFTNITSTAITGFSNAQLNVVNVATANATTLVGVGANVRMNTTAISVGNSSVFTNITPTTISGFSNAQLNVVNVASANATTLVGVGANVRMNTTSLFVGNATLNVAITSSSLSGTINVIANNFSGLNFYATDGFAAANSILAPSGLFLGYSETTNVVISTSTIRLTNSTSNTGLSIPTSVQRAGDYFLHANGSWVRVAPSVPSALTVETFIANTSAKIGNTSANLSVNSTVLIYANSAVAARFAVYANGNIGVANATPTQKFSVTGNVYATGELIAASDRAFKEEIEQIQGALPMIRKLRGSKYYMKDDEDINRRKRFGLIAQEVEKVIPELVSGKRGKKGLSYMGLIPILVEAVKELSAQVEKLQNDRKS